MLLHTPATLFDLVQAAPLSKVNGEMQTVPGGVVFEFCFAGPSSGREGLKKVM